MHKMDNYVVKRILYLKVWQNKHRLGFRFEIYGHFHEWKSLLKNLKYMRLYVIWNNIDMHRDYVVKWWSDIFMLAYLLMKPSSTHCREWYIYLADS